MAGPRRSRSLSCVGRRARHACSARCRCSGHCGRNGLIDRYLLNGLRPQGPCDSLPVEDLRSPRTWTATHARNSSTRRTCRNAENRKEPLYSGERSRSAVMAVGRPVLGVGRDNFRDSLGDRSVPVTQRPSYTWLSRAVRWPSGRRRRFAKPLYGLKPVSRVRIPASPPIVLFYPSIFPRAQRPSPTYLRSHNFSRNG
jgi:hypothetical protein